MQTHDATRFPKRTVAIAGIREGGIGQASTKRFLDDGYFALCCDKDGEAGYRAVEALKSRSVAFIEADVSTETGVAAFMRHIRRYAETLDVMVCNAGCAGSVNEDNLLDLTVEQMQRLFENNFLSAYLLINQSLKEFFLPQRSGSVILVGSHNGQRSMGLLGQPGYGSFKTALTGLLTTLVARFGREVRFNLVRPGITLTNSPNWQERLLHEPDWADNEGLHNPMGRLGEPEDVANAIAWLASDEARFVQGVELPVDGGLDCAGLQFPAWSSADNFRQAYVGAVKKWMHVNGPLLVGQS